MQINPEQVVDQVVTFIQQTFSTQQKTKAVIAVSGGIDSAVALTLLAKAIGSEQVTALLLPFGDQSVKDSETICEFVGLQKTAIKTIQIQPIVTAAMNALSLDANTPETSFRVGNIMARTRMICVFDQAKAQDALVCGTENKSEHYLGYFTRFGDAASDLEPISTLYKTQVRELATYLKLPKEFLEKSPSAGLWDGQTDEDEMGFSYERADLVLEQLIDQKVNPEKIQLPSVSANVVRAVVSQVQKMAFKRAVPYELEERV